MVRGSSASKNLRLALCGSWLAALAACAAPPAAPVFTLENTASRANVAVSETELRGRAERVFARLVLANADVCRPFVVRQTGSRETSRWQCDQQLVVNNDNSVNAFATPNIVTVSIGMLRFLRGDDDLAFILAHEMSHNLIEQANWRQAGFAPPPQGSLKIDLVAMREEPVRDVLPEPAHGQEDETAADYLGVYLAARAGFAMDKVTLLMRSLSALEPPSSPAIDEAHPLIVWRYLAIDRAIREIAAKQTAGLPLIPVRR